MNERFPFSERLARAKSVVFLSIAFLGVSCSLTENGSATVGPKSVEDVTLAVNSGLQGVIFIGDSPCPEGGDIIDAEELFAQDYVYPADPDEELMGPADFFAVNPKFGYLPSGDNEWQAYCGPDFGANGTSFAGNAVVFASGTTIIGHGLFGK